MVHDRTILRCEVVIPDPRFPDSVSIISGVDDGTYRQHCFDARGIARLYKMTLDGEPGRSYATGPTSRPWTFRSVSQERQVEM